MEYEHGLELSVGRRNLVTLEIGAGPWKLERDRGENHASAVVRLPHAFCSAKRGRRILRFWHSPSAYICACHRKVYMRAVYARTRRHANTDV